MEAKVFKDLKKSIKSKCDDVKTEKRNFDSLQSNTKKLVVAQNSEKIMHEIDKLMNDYNFQIKMF